MDAVGTVPVRTSRYAHGARAGGLRALDAFSSGTIRPTRRGPDRDQFVLSCGHASMLLYSLLHLAAGYDLHWKRSKRSGSGTRRRRAIPKQGHTPGVETTTGPAPPPPWPRRRQRRRHGDRRAIPRRAVQPAGTPGSRPPRLGLRQRRRSSWKGWRARPPRSPGTCGSAS